MSRPALIASVLLLASCRGCLVDGVSVEDGAGGAAASTGTGLVGSTATTVAGPTAGSTSAASSPEASSATAGGDGGAPSATGTGGDGGAPSATATGEIVGATASTASTTGTGGASSSTGTGGLDCPSSEDFTGVSTLSETCFTRINPALGSVSIVDEQLVIDPVNGQQTGWYGPTEGPTVEQTVTGDFLAGVRVRVVASEGDYQMSGFLVRDPAGASGAQSWVKWEIGLRDDGDELPGPTPGFVEREWRTLFGGNDEGVANVPFPAVQAFELFEIEDATVEGVLALCRQGDALHAFYGDEDDPAPLLYAGMVDTADEGDPDDAAPELPETILLGLTAGAFSDGYANVSTFDDFRLQVGEVTGDCDDALALFYGQ